MAIFAAAHAELCRLRRDIARIEGRLADDDRLAEAALSSAPFSGDVAADERMRRKSGGRLALGIAALDAVLGGGLPLAALTEIRAAQSRDGGVVSGFALALVARLIGTAGGSSSIVWIGEADLRRETGALYAPGLAALGLDPARVVEVAVRTEKEALWAFEAALSCRGLGVAVCELRKASLDLSATRRCALRARESGRHRLAASPRKRMGGAERGGNPLPRRAGAGRRDRRFRRRRRPHGLAADAGEEPSGADRRLHGGVECP